MPVLAFNGVTPSLAPGVFVAPGAMVIGDVTIGEGSSVWYNAVLRGDIAPIRIGKGSNVQDGAVLHVDEGVPCVLGDGVVIGHGAVVHSATVGNGAMVAMHATLLSHAKIGDECIVGANALVAEGKEFPARSLIVGIPGKVLRDVTDEQAEAIRENARRYAAYAQKHRDAMSGQE
ncbi:MAG TPA: gamma carbonic anhydrase family protein [Chloroflexota bacterium]|nr:gamma carbonic anhydrase family protein [Chloroflexota bacterium]